MNQTEKRHFPLPILPQDSELLSSYLTRVAQAHGEKASAFCHAYFGKRQIWNVDLDRTNNLALLELVAKYTRLDVERIRMMTLADYEEILSAGPRRKGKGVWILAAGSFHQLRRRYWLQFCPRCLEEDDRPYFRREWRLAFVVGCERHHLPLLDSCPSCERALAPHRTPPGGMTTCPFCWTSLLANKSTGGIPSQTSAPSSGVCRSGGSAELASGSRVNPSFDASPQIASNPSNDTLSNKGDDFPPPLWATQLEAVSALRDGYAVLGNSTIPAEEYFATLRAIASALAPKNQLQLACERYGISIPPLGNGERHEVELSRRAYRVAILQVLCGLLSDWPVSFDAGAKVVGFTKRSFRLDCGEIPSLSNELAKLSPGIARPRGSRAADTEGFGTSDSSGIRPARRRIKNRSSSGASKSSLLQNINRLRENGSTQSRAARAELVLGSVAQSRGVK